VQIGILENYTLGAYSASMVFVESSLFTRLLSGYLEDDRYQELQAFLANRPDAGAIIRGAGGLRKIRWMGRQESRETWWRADHLLLACGE